MRPSKRLPRTTPFASRGWVEHLVRGAVGIGALSQATALSATHPVWSLLLVGVSLLAFRGCPICWVIGLVETVYRDIAPAPRSE